MEAAGRAVKECRSGERPVASGGRVREARALISASAAERGSASSRQVPGRAGSLKALASTRNKLEAVTGGGSGGPTRATRAAGAQQKLARRGWPAT
jgi:hypothetical protein